MFTFPKSPSSDKQTISDMSKLEKQKFFPGEKSMIALLLKCFGCNSQIKTEKGEIIPDCPHCGKNIYFTPMPGNYYQSF